MNPSGDALLERRLTLPPDPSSPGAARRALREVMGAVGREEWLEVAELAVSEVVTNASLHAHTPIDLRVAAFEDQVCVEVRDFNPILPVQREYEDRATTGRGMGLVAALSSSCGVQSLGRDGKVVWFCVGPELPRADPDALLDAWDIDSPDLDSLAAGDPGEDCVEVVLRSLPPTLWLSAREHHDAIIRELVLYLAEHDEIEADVASADWARAMISTRVAAAVEAAQAEGRAVRPSPGDHPSSLPWVPGDLDLVIPVLIARAGAFAVLQDVLDLGERLAVAGDLLVRPALPEIVAVRDWACEQVIAQVAGSPAAPWLGTAQQRFETAVDDRAAGDRPSQIGHAAEANVGVVAADDANRIVAVSRPLAALVGWEAEELVGRRVITLIPPTLREAHVAGFSRHLSTGEAHVLGEQLQLPVLRRDGTEIPCSVMVEQVPGSGGRNYYLAWIEQRTRL